MNDSRRITLVSRNPRSVQRKWNRSKEAPSRVVTVDSHTVVNHTIRAAEMDLDIERIVLDRSASASEYLSFLAGLPHTYHGDVLYIREDETAFLSAAGRGGDRLIYALSADDLRFYCEMHALTTNETGVAAQHVPQVSEDDLTVAYAM